MFSAVETPKLILDKGRVENNAQRFLDIATENNVLLRPHLKTSKSEEIAKIGTNGRMSSVTVSTLKEAEYFASCGFRDILYAVGIAPNKLPHVKKIIEGCGGEILLITDDVSVARAAIAFAEVEQCPLQFLIELDCGEHRGGVTGDGPELVEIAQLFHDSPLIQLKGVMTHAGHSYASKCVAEIQDIAETERRTAVDGARRLSQMGINCEIISVGSTPTFLYAQSFEGLTEVRGGVYLFFDLAQFSRKVCTINDIAISVLATVIGHNKQGRSLIVDAGAFALSKDLSANTFLSDVDFGYVCDPWTLKRFGALSINAVHQEHGTISVEDDVWFEQLPVGSMVRILPNHACATAAAYQDYLVIEGDTLVGEWGRVNGW